jgi:alpha-tubulin suppressor-like RCC1 family protein
MNVHGELGMGTKNNTSHPIPIKVGIEHVVAISASVYRTIALLQDGTVWRWGATNYSNMPIPPTCVKGMPKMVAVTAGGGEDMCLTNEGSVWDIGSTNVAVPFQQTWLDNAVAVAALRLHWIALRSDGSLWAWGDNREGQLGIGTADFDGSATGLRVHNLTSAEVIVGMAAGYFFSMSLGEAGIWTWGANSHGQLGDGSALDRRCEPSLVMTGMFLALAAGTHHSLAVDWNGSVWVWGNNSDGQLGDGTTMQRNMPIQVPNFSLW